VKDKRCKIKLLKFTVNWLPGASSDDLCLNEQIETKSSSSENLIKLINLYPALHRPQWAMHNPQAKRGRGEGLSCLSHLTKPPLRMFPYLEASAKEPGITYKSFTANDSTEKMVLLQQQN